MLLLSSFILDLINCMKLILSIHANHNTLLICKVGRQFRIYFYSFVITPCSERWWCLSFFLPCGS